MKTAQALSDKLAIGLSFMCTIHCLATPLFILWLPSLLALPLESEAFHVWLVVAVIPSSLYALTLGCKQHRRYRLLFLGAIGLSLLIAALVLGEDVLGEVGEQALTVLGAGFIAIGHWFNYRLCRAQDQQPCACPNRENN